MKNMKIRTMEIETAKIGERGQITIPIEFRRELGFEEGDTIVFVKMKKGIFIEPAKKINSMKDLEKIPDLETLFKKADKIKPKYNLSAKQMDEFNERIF